MALLAIDLGRREPWGDPFVEGVEQMIAAAVCSAGAFGSALLARARLTLRARLAGCAGLLLASAASLGVAWPPRTEVRWRRVAADGEGWSVEFPAPVQRAERTAKSASGEEEERALSAQALGATFVARESEAPGAGGRAATPAELLRRARAAALPSGRERIVEERALPVGPVAQRPAGVAAQAGLELLFRLDGHDHLARLYAAPGRLVVLTVGPIDRARPEARRFLESFQWSR